MDWLIGKWKIQKATTLFLTSRQNKMTVLTYQKIIRLPIKPTLFTMKKSVYFIEIANGFTFQLLITRIMPNPSLLK